MSWNVPGWIPGAPVKDDTAVCALRPPCRFPPQHRILLSPGSLAAALPVQLLHRAGFDYSPGGRARLAA
jgi:hypothetical protein